ncbi:MAG: ElyC/SanA/YdcF family protein [Bacteroidota bacterium]
MRRRWFIISGILAAVVLALVLILDAHISASTKPYLYDDTSMVPMNKTGVLLGTSKYSRSGTLNEFWKNRIDAAIRLYKSGKIMHLIISGDNRKLSYNEPAIMKKELVRCGIPDSVIYPDYAGFRTFDSMIRAEKVFGQTSFTVISQEFHNQRAVYIARHYGMNAIGYNAKGVTAWYGLRTNVREKLARVKLFFDLLFDKQPKFLGEKITIE